MAKEKLTGSEILIKSLLAEGVDTVFGYPGGAITPVFDCMYDYQDELKHILVRHEQGATHAAQGYARVSGKTGVVIVTSGPGATNTITGIADAMMDSTPMVVIAGQMPSSMLGTDAFQETDVVGITLPITKWSYQIRRAEDVAWAVARAFYIASTGRPGPVMLDFAKNAQTEVAEFEYKKCNYIRSYNPYPNINEESVRKAAEMINAAKKPLLLVGQGVTLGGAEQEIIELMEKADIPAATTLLGLSSIPSSHPLNMGMLGMHGNVAPNVMTNECDLLIAVGMRFDDRVTAVLDSYAKQAKKIHFDIDPSEFNKNVAVDLSVLGNSKESIAAVTALVEKRENKEWLQMFDRPKAEEKSKVIDVEVAPESGPLKMGEVVSRVSKYTNDNAVVVTDVGQNQMMGVRYSKYSQPRSVITSGGLGTMGFGLPAAVGAKFGAPARTVCLFVGDGGLQMTLQELGTIKAYGVNVKIILLTNTVLGMVRQWQELFFEKRFSETNLSNPDFVALAAAYGIKGRRIEKREELDEAIEEMLQHDGSYLLEAVVAKEEMVFPMTPTGKSVNYVMLNRDEIYKL
ncbi:MAG: biosynthetic-type acetolactate synthase large subunit [Muribaculaceae bacterium]|nr:biosynthetic-type acetolactate synthase large subunit [Muribaculaceae bacterium]